MAIAVICAGCSAKLNAPDSAAGKKVKCPRCQTAIVVPAPLPDEPAFEVVEDEPAKKPVSKPAVKTDVMLDEDEEVKPRKNRRIIGEDDEDDQPRRKKKTAAAGNPRLVRNIIGGVVLLVALGVAGWVFYDKPGKKDEGTVASEESKPPKQAFPVIQPKDSRVKPVAPADPAARARIAAMSTAIRQLNSLLEEMTGALNKVSDNETALAAATPLQEKVAQLIKLNDELKTFGKVSATEAGWVPGPSGKAGADLIAAVNKVTGLLASKAISGQAAKEMEKAVGEVHRVMDGVSTTLIAMWPDVPKN